MVTGPIAMGPTGSLHSVHAFAQCLWAMFRSVLLAAAGALVSAKLVHPFAECTATVMRQLLDVQLANLGTWRISPPTRLLLWRAPLPYS